MATRARASSLSSTGSSSNSDVVLVQKKAMRPRLGSQNKRVSFDATSVPLPSATWEEFATASTVATSPPFALPLPSQRGNALRKSEIDSTVDLKAILAQGIMQWRTEVEDDSETA